jgi:hypothetical protein
MDVNTIVNGMYHSAVLSGLVIENCMIAQKLFKASPPNLGKIDIKDVGKLTLNVYLAMMTRNWLVKQGILPADVSLPPNA